MKRAFLFFISVVFLLSVTAACTKAERPLSVEELLDLGEKYLLEQSYEQAVVQFLKAIEIEPMNPRGYTGAAEAYIGLGRTEEAVTVLQQGRERTDDNSILSMLEGLTENTAVEETMVPDIDDESSNELTAEQIEQIQELLKALESEDYAAAAAIVAGDIYQQLVEKSEQSNVLYQGTDTYLMIYPSGHVYCGEMIDGMRSGTGIWLHGNSDEAEYTYYKGQWANDLPNGQGTIRTVTDESRLVKEEGSTYGLYSESTGVFKDGLFDGVFTITWSMDNGEVHTWTPSYESGVAKAMPDAVVNEDGYYDIAICTDCRANLLGKESRLNSVFGFGD